MADPPRDHWLVNTRLQGEIMIILESRILMKRPGSDGTELVLRRQIVMSLSRGLTRDDPVRTPSRPDIKGQQK